jgi:hypothetical protein
MLDTKITQGSYWKGAQIPRWIYLALVIFPFTGAFGIDHLVLRSPITAALKLLSLIPLFGFWYFYDIAQACGERELIEKYGLAVPFYGPTGIGAGMFIKEGQPESPKEVPKPWLFVAYAIATILFVAFPINKFLMGNYELGIFNLILFFSFILIPVVIYQGVYDIYNLFFDTKSIFEKGITAAPGVSGVISMFKGIGLASTRVVTGAAKEEVRRLGLPPVEDLGAAVKSLEQKLPEAVGAKLVNIGHKAETIAEGELGAASSGLKAVGNTANAVSAVSTELAKEIKEHPESAIALLGAVPKPITQAGGGLSTFIPSAPILLFSVGLLAFSGYVFYMFRNTYSKPEKSDDPPREPRVVRKPVEREQQES